MGVPKLKDILTGFEIQPKPLHYSSVSTDSLQSGLL